MTIEFQNTKADYKKFSKLHLKNDLQKRIAAVVIISLLLGYAVSGQPFQLISFLLGAIISATLFITIFYFLPYLIFLKKISKAIANNPEYLEKKKASITEEGIYFETATRTGTWKWESIVSVESNTHFISLVLADKKQYLIPKRAFVSYNDEVNFLGTVQSKIIKVRGALKLPTTSVDKKPPYLLGLICLIPLIGAIVGAVFIILGVTSYKDKWFTLIGAGGILFTIIVYSFLFNAGRNSPMLKQGLADLSQTQLNSLVTNIEFYKLKNGQYPDSLQQLLKDDKFAPLKDIIQLNLGNKKRYYNYQKAGEKYFLFSSGLDGVPNTDDDFYPQTSINDSSKIGLIRKQ